MLLRSRSNVVARSLLASSHTPIRIAVAPNARSLSCASNWWDGSHGGGYGGWRRIFFNTSARSIAAVGLGGTALCAGQDQHVSDDDKSQADMFLESFTPLLSQMTVGSVMGYAAGYALQVVGRMAAFSIGVVFMGVQAAAYNGYIQVDWGKTTGDLRKFLDQDGDGDFDASDMKVLMHKFIEVCTFNLPSGAGFTGGLLLGLGFGGSTAGKAAAAVSAATLVPRVMMMGGAATAGPGVMLAIKDQYDRAREATGVVITRMSSKSEAKVFTDSLKNTDLSGLRLIERDLKTKVNNASGPEKIMLTQRLNEVEEKKIDWKLKKQK